jgi:putative RecB family exonuclease
MAVYSNSKIETFEQCRLKFKYRYIDKIIPEIAKGIEAHLGDMVHRTLEWLYIQVMKNAIPSVNDLISFYSEKWQEIYSPDMPIVNKTMTAKDYFNRGVEFLINYYMKYHPFQDNTIATEKRIEIDLDGIGNKRLIGYIDRLAHNLENNEIEIHDYKTSNTIMTKEKVENSRQLSIYSLAIKEMFGKEKNVCMIWHFLAHDMKICLRKTNEQLEQLRKEIIELIEEIERTRDFPPTKSQLCYWCEYMDICPIWNKNSKREKQEELKFKNEEEIENKLDKL